MHERNRDETKEYFGRGKFTKAHEFRKASLRVSPVVNRCQETTKDLGIFGEN